MCQIEYTSVSTSDTAVLCSKKILTNTCETGADDCYQNRVWDFELSVHFYGFLGHLKFTILKKNVEGGGLEVG